MRILAQEQDPVKCAARLRRSRRRRAISSRRAYKVLTLVGGHETVTDELLLERYSDALSGGVIIVEHAPRRPAVICSGEVGCRWPINQDGPDTTAGGGDHLCEALPELRVAQRVKERMAEKAAAHS